MKKSFLVIVSLVFFSAGLFAQKTTDLNAAISTSAREISKVLPARSNVAVVTFFSDTPELSTHITNQMISGIKGAGLQTVLERDPKKMALIDAEQDYQYSGAVSDSSMVEIGYKLGAQYLVYGAFDQLGGVLQLSIQATNVETAEILYFQVYSVQSSSTVTKLLGEKMELVSLNDFLEAITRCDRKISALNANKVSANDNGKEAVMTKYSALMQEVYSIEKEPWESTAEYDEKINAKIDALLKKRDGELFAISEAYSPKYDQQINAVEAQKAQIVTDLKNTTFVLKDDSIQSFIGDFDPEAKPKNWPVSVKSLDKNVAYIFNGKYVVNDADVKTEYLTVEQARKDKDLAAEIRYKVAPSKSGSSSFDVIIDSVLLKIASSGAVLVNASVKKNAGVIDANKILDGGNSVKGPSKANVTTKVTQVEAPKAAVKETKPAVQPKANTPAPKVVPAAKSIHPRSYIVDPADVSKVWKIERNDYSSVAYNYQSVEGSHYSFVSTDKPKAGDMVQLRGKFISSIDIPNLYCLIVDASEAANWWTDLCGNNDRILVAKKIKAGKSVDINLDLVLKKDVKEDFRVIFQYDDPSVPGKLVFTKVANTTDTSKETAVAVNNGNVKTIDVGQHSSMVKINTNHPWVDGKQDMSVISNYEGYVDLTPVFNKKLPVKGDKIQITWKGKSDRDIKCLKARLVDRSPEANWWTELSGEETGIVIAENIKAGVVFQIEPTIFTLSTNAIADVDLVVWYEIEDGAGPAVIKAVK